MAEERMIDEDKDRKYRIRKNEFGEDVLELVNPESEEEEESDVPVFDIPVFESDDEEAALLTPEQLAERKRLEEEEKKSRAEKCAEFIKTAQAKLEEGDYEAALYAVKQAEQADEKNGGVYSLKLTILSRGLTDFTSLEECANAAEGVLQYSSKEEKQLLSAQSEGLKKQIAETSAETERLATENEAKKEERRGTFALAKKGALRNFICTAVPFVALLIATIVLSTMMFSSETGVYLIATIVLGALALITFIVMLVMANRYWTAARNVVLNEKDFSTALGREYLKCKNDLELLNKISASIENDISR